MVKIFFPSQFPENCSPSQRFRFEQFEAFLNDGDIHITLEPFIDENTYAVIYKKGNYFKKVFGVIKGFVRRFISLFTLHRFDMIYIQREASPIGPPVFEWLYAKVFRKKIIYDFDDAIWIPATSKNNRISHGVKCFWKIKYIIKWSAAVIGGNDYLCRYALLYNKNVFKIPTSVSIKKTEPFLNQPKEPMVTVVWTGSFTTLVHLYELAPYLLKVYEATPFLLKVICNAFPKFDFPQLKYIEWNTNNEFSEIASGHIGIMPSEKLVWSEGKCGFKLIQYMSLGIPCIADHTEANKHILDNASGIIVYEKEEWVSNLTQLINDPELRKNLSVNGLQRVKELFSTEKNADALIRIIMNLKEKK